jgi:hypothetical protein
MRLTIATVGRVEDEVSPDAREQLLAAFRHWRRT